MTLYYKTHGERLADGTERWYAFQRVYFCWLIPYWDSLASEIMGGYRPIAATQQLAREACELHAAKIIAERRYDAGRKKVQHLTGEIIVIKG